jgi:L-sorbose 1-phosphate reductase
MRTKAVRIYGKNDLRLEEFELPALKEDEILAQVVSDSICTSSYKAVKQGADHKRVPNDVDSNPTMIGHEFSGKLVEVGKKWSDRFQPGMKYSIQPALNYKGSLNAPGYSYPYTGGDATYIIIPNEVMEMGCLLPYAGTAYFPASLSEPISCIVGAFHASYHTKPGSYKHDMDIREKGHMAFLAGAGPMGLGAIEYALRRNRRPQKLVVTDIDDERMAQAEHIFPPDRVKAQTGVDLFFMNTKDVENPVEKILSLTDQKGFDDVFIFAPVKQLIEQGDALLARDGCLNFFAGPTKPDFEAAFNFYNVHYAATHIVGTSGGNTQDMQESLDLMSKGQINPAFMITHIGGLDSVIDTTKNLPDIPGGKKLIYTHIQMDLTAIDDFEHKGAKDPFFKRLHELVQDNNGFWSAEAEHYLLEHAPTIQ